MGEWILPAVKAEMEQYGKAVLERRMESEIELKIREHRTNYVILDAAVWEDCIDEALESVTEYASLFAVGGADTELDSVAPYLIKYDDNKSFGEWLNASQQRELRRLYLKSDLSVEKLRLHLRRFIRTKTEDGRWLFFRFYDPYVVNCVFPNLTRAQLSEFFAPVDYMIAEDARINGRRVFYLSADRELRIKYGTINDVDNN
jgi:hypothetical protein